MLAAIENRLEVPTAVTVPVCLPPWKNPYRLVSLLDMLRFAAHHYVNLSKQIARITTSIDLAPLVESTGDVNLQRVFAKSEEANSSALDAIKGTVSILRDECIELGLEMSVAQIDRIRECDSRASKALLIDLFTELSNRIEDELKTSMLLCVDSAKRRYFEDPQLFGEDVFNHLPSANQELTEAGTCLALDRGTACVFHASRALESALQVLASDLGVGSQNDWGRYLKGVEDELKNRMQASGARTVKEQFYAEAHATFDSVRRAWRNPTMHVDKSYSPDRAADVLSSVGLFIKHLATELHE